MFRKPYKLTLLDKLNKLPHSDYEIAMKFFPDRLKIHPSTWKRWIYMREDNKLQIPSNAVIQMAIFFQCEPSEMFTTPINATEVNQAWETFKNSFLEQLGGKLFHQPISETHV